MSETTPVVTHVVVDGSNIATEGRSLPSLAQLDEAVQAYLREYPNSEVTVVVDASFGHRIDPSEHQLYEEAYAAGELIAPPAGAIGRGDAFILRIAEKIGAVVFSNDSFQEFHGEHEWLFTKGRLIGAKPVPGIGWVFMPRTPVRGEKSRLAVRDAKRERDGGTGGRGRGRARRGPVTKAIAEATQEITAPLVPKIPPPRGPRKAATVRAGVEVIEAAGDVDGDGADGGGKGRRRRRRGSAPPIEALNAPLTFLQFVSDHRPGTTVEGLVESFSSHGAFVDVGDAKCYIPLKAMGDPAPRAAREVFEKGETRTFVVQALDAPRRGIELALPGFARPSGQASEETIAGEIEGPDDTDESTAAPRKRTAKAATKRARKAATPKAPAVTPAAGDPSAPAKGAAKATKKSATKKAAPAAKATATKAAAKKTTKATAARKPTTTEAAAPKAAGSKAASTKVAAKKAATTKVAATKVAAKKATVTKTAATKTTAAKTSDAKPTPTKTGAKKKAGVKKTAGKKAVAVDAAAPKKSVATKSAVKKAAPKKAAVAKQPAAKKAGAKKSARSSPPAG